MSTCSIAYLYYRHTSLTMTIADVEILAVLLFTACMFLM